MLWPLSIRCVEILENGSVELAPPYGLPLCDRGVWLFADRFERCSE
jgi:hypothetical protein